MTIPRIVKTTAAVTAPIAAACGVVLGYLLDPDRGKARRHKLADQTAAQARRQARKAASRLRYQKGRLRGSLARAGGAGTPAPTDDVDVKQAIHQALRRANIPLRDIAIEVSNRTAVLRGQVPTVADIDRIQDITMRVPGVDDVESYLHTPGEPAPNKIDVLRLSHSTH